jgi:hypothetical protein
MATVRRRRGRRIRSYVTGAIRRYLLGILFVALGVAIIGALTYLVGLVPEATITLGSDPNAVTISNKLILNFISFAVGIIFVITGIKKFLPRF